MSIGVSLIKPGETDFQQIYQRADNNLYHAKHLGKDCYVIE
ncbi:diguanylate cyclase domain-containing protein [Sharpea azabuensis]|nr:diguanylate cyclase [Sharpea azabuensis]